MTVQAIIDAESQKLCDAADALRRGEITDAEAILKGISALTGTVAAVALALVRKDD